MPQTQLSNSSSAVISAAVSALIAGRPALGQNWTAIRLHREEMYRSHALAADGRLVGGNAVIGAHTKPVLWDSSAGTWSDLTPTPFEGGSINAAFGARQGGHAGTSQTAHAAVWAGTAQSFVDLHPSSNPYISEIQAMDDRSQAGYYQPTIFDEPRAALWTGSAGSFTSLHPQGAYHSEARGVAGGIQGGFYRQTEASGYRAVVWSGTAQSMSVLHPAGAIESQIFGVAPGEQVGWSSAPVTHAAMWHGTAASFTDMNPPGAGLSLINATCGSAQAGYANFNGDIAAVVWFGSPNNFVRLDQFLPAGYGESVATGVSFSDGLYYVSGYASTATGAGPHAYVWIGVPAPGTVIVLACPALTFARRRRR